MKKSLQLLSAGVLFSVSVMAQHVRPNILTGGKTSTLSPISTYSVSDKNPETRAMALCDDKVTYVDNNGVGNPATDYVKVGGIGWNAAMQSFPDFTGSVTRIDFKAQSYTGTETVQASIHAVDASNMPIGTPLGSVNVNVGTTLTEYGATLPSPVSVTNGFAVIIWDLENGDSVKVMMNGNGDGQSFGYSWIFYGNIYNFLADYSIDADFLMRPTIRFNTRTLTLSASPTTLCAGQSVTFNYNSGSTPVHYMSNVYNPNGVYNTLNYGDGSPAGSAPSSHTYANGGTFNAQLTETYDGWSTNCPGDPASQTITVNPAPTSGFTWSANQLAVTFTNTCTNTTSYAWLFGDATNSAAPNPVHNYAASGTYTVELTATGPCGNDYYTTNITITDSTAGGSGVNDLSNQLLVNLYPNPVNDVFTLQIESSYANEVQVEVLSPVGQVVSSRSLGITNQTATAFDMSAFANGVYFLRVVQGNSRIIKPFIKN